MRVVTVVVGVVHLLVVGALVRELGGGRFAQALAALAVVLSPATLFLTHAYSMNVFDLVFWSAGALALLIALRTGTTGTWVALGAIVGLGFLNKWSMAWFAGASIVAVALTRERRVFASRGPWLAAAIAAALAAPNLLWQQANGWPTLEFMANAAAFKMLSCSSR
jgi:4-amino-4-deoxy-L-arabinose transferase-like glycosyltransferase